MNHYTNARVVKALATRLVRLQVQAGLIRITNSRQYRNAVLTAAHQAYLETVQ